MPRAALDPSARGLWQLVRDQVGVTPSARQDLLRAERVLQERRTASQAFFSSTAGQWDRVRAELYGSRTDLVPLAALLDPHAVVGDLGCGSGQTSAALAPFVARVVAIDESSAMLAAAHERIGHHANVELRSGRLEALPLDDAALDIAVLSLVLHFVVDPAAVIRRSRARAQARCCCSSSTWSPRTRGVPLDDGPPLARLLRRADDVVARVGRLRDATHRSARPDPQAKGPALFTARAIRSR
jgi:ArsR family transcriptional regulator